jgi:hypothetical protein
MNIGISSIPASPVSQTGSFLVLAPQLASDISRYGQTARRGRGGRWSGRAVGDKCAIRLMSLATARDACHGSLAGLRRPRKACRVALGPAGSAGAQARNGSRV